MAIIVVKIRNEGHLKKGDGIWNEEEEKGWSHEVFKGKFDNIWHSTQVFTL